MSLKNKKLEMFYLALVIVTIVLLWFGITHPLITIKLNSDINAGVAQFNNDVIDTTRSIWGTVLELHQRDRTLVAFLIFFFSVIIPILKSFIFSTILFASEKKDKLKRLLSLISKWSMADVFVVAVFLAFLATDGQIEVTHRKFKVIGMTFNVTVKALMETTLKTGFYYFLSYCLLSMIVFQSWNFIQKKKLPSV